MRVAVRNLLDNRVLLFNAGSLVGTMVVTSVLGFAYWWLAAQLFVPAVVGLASAAVSAMMLLTEVGIFGVGTLLLGELPQRPNEAGSLITTAVLLAGGLAGILGILFVAAAPRLSDSLRPLADSPQNVVVFVLGVILMTVAIVADQSVVGLLRSELKLSRNTLMAVAKFIVLLLAGLWVGDQSGMTIYATWGIGVLISLLGLLGYAWWKMRRVVVYRPDWKLVPELGRSALGHHALNLALQSPTKAMPLLVTTLLSAEANAAFYIAWMIATLLFDMPGALTTVLYAIGAKDPGSSKEKTRFTLRLSFLIGALASVVLLVAAGPVLGLFGSTYAEMGTWSLRILTIGFFPIVIKSHYVAICRIHGRLARAALIMGIGAILEIVLAALGAIIGGMVGLTIGWVVAVCVEAMITIRTVYHASAATQIG
jgi:O-antigen/teichoic acid export membrane protein